ncbi:MAG: hypothetical protein GC204_15865 [Chloroflexi bacterium]|nr:hypothetical protein [Chloroflexota bacterium]
MPIEHTWIDEAQTIVMIALEGKVTVEDYFAGDAHMCAMLDSVDHAVDVICDYTGQYYFAPGYADFVQKMDSLFRPNLRSAVFVGNKLGWELFHLYTLAYESMPFSFGYVETLEEAYEMIRQTRFTERLTSHRPNSPESN